jgi:hypothetical protein
MPDSSDLLVIVVSLKAKDNLDGCHGVVSHVTTELFE